MILIITPQPNQAGRPCGAPLGSTVLTAARAFSLMVLSCNNPVTSLAYCPYIFYHFCYTDDTLPHIQGCGRFIQFFFFLPEVFDWSMESCRWWGQCICIAHDPRSKAKMLLLNSENKKFPTECFLCKEFLLFYVGLY